MSPVLIGDKIKDPGDNEIWQLVLQLREIVELICSPAISTGHIAYLRVITDEYLHCRKEAFPKRPLMPKHHYVSHYPELILQFAPLIRLWTLRFESKHTYFKQCLRKFRNVKNPCSTLAEKRYASTGLYECWKVLPPTCFSGEEYTDVTVVIS